MPCRSEYHRAGALSGRRFTRQATVDLGTSSRAAPFFANQGALRTGDYEEILNKVSALALLSNAVLVGNTVRIPEIVASIEARGQAVRPEHLVRISPLAHARVIPSGTYHFDRATARARGQHRTPGRP